MADNQEYTSEDYNNWCTEESNLKAKQKRLKKEVEDNEKKIERLKTCREKMEDAKSDYKNEVLNPDKSLLKDAKNGRGKIEWRGSNKDDFCLVNSEEINEANKRFRSGAKSLDTVRDELNNEITRLKNINLEKEGILGKIAARLNWLWTKIDNWFE